MNDNIVCTNTTTNSQNTNESGVVRKPLHIPPRLFRYSLLCVLGYRLRQKEPCGPLRDDG